MTGATAHERHRAHHTRARARARDWLLVAAFAFAPTPLGCGSSLPRPAFTQVAVDDYKPVPFPPRVPPVEFVPPSPSKEAVWIDGTWEWTGDRYAWRFGTWVIPPANVRRARWVVVRRSTDGQLFFAPSTWKDAAKANATVDAKEWEGALGTRARARTRVGARSAPSLSFEGPITTPPPEEDLE